MAKHNVKHIHITPAENGFSAEVVHEEKPGKKGEIQPYDANRETHVFPHINHLTDFLHKKLGGGATTSVKTGKSKTQSKGSSRMDTYEGGATKVE
jgi:hypothetical protein